MADKFLLYLTDDGLTLNQGAYEEIRFFSTCDLATQQELNAFFHIHSKASLFFLIDRSGQDVQEEKLPPLSLWDRYRLVAHKKAEWKENRGKLGVQTFRQEKETYLRWVHILPHDPLFPWLSWLDTLLVSKKQIFFTSLEAQRFLQQYLSYSKGYQILFSPSSNKMIRHSIFKEKRFLLSRLSEKPDAFTSSLHYLSRSFPDIYENLHGISLFGGINFDLPQVRVLPDRKAFFQFILNLKRPSLSFHQPLFFSKNFIQHGMNIVASLLVFVSTYFVYEGINDRNQSALLLSEIRSSEDQKNKLKNSTQGQNVPYLESALASYHRLQGSRNNPMEAIEKVATLLQAHDLPLNQFKWLQKDNVEVVLEVIFENPLGTTLASRLEDFLLSLQMTFPNHYIKLLEAPFHSHTHETLEIPTRSDFPIAHIQIITP